MIASQNILDRDHQGVSNMHWTASVWRGKEYRERFFRGIYFWSKVISFVPHTNDLNLNFFMVVIFFHNLSQIKQSSRPIPAASCSLGLPRRGIGGRQRGCFFGRRIGSADN